MARIATEQIGQRSAGSIGVSQARRTGAGIGVTGIDHQRADAAAGLCRRCQMGFRDLHRRRAKAIGGEHARHRGAVGQLQHQQILAVGFFYACFGMTEQDAGHGREIGGERQRGIDGHDMSTLLIDENIL